MPRAWPLAAAALAIAAGVAATAAGCQTQPTPQPPQAVYVSHCAPGAQVACACPDGQMGVQICDDRGARFGACERCAHRTDGDRPAAPSSTAVRHAGAAPDDERDDEDWPTPAPTHTPSAQPVAGLAPLPTSVPLSPLPPGLDCSQTRECIDWGRCTATYGGCALTSTADCQQSGQCRRWGACTFQSKGGHGRCGVSSDADCRRSRRCKESGYCTAKDGSCIAAKAADCRQTDLCKQRGLCSARDGECVAATAADCRGAEACQTAGFCRAQGGLCVR